MGSQTPTLLFTQHLFPDMIPFAAVIAVFRCGIFTSLFCSYYHGFTHLQTTGLSLFLSLEPDTNGNGIIQYVFFHTLIISLEIGFDCLPPTTSPPAAGTL